MGFWKVYIFIGDNNFVFKGIFFEKELGRKLMFREL